MCYRKAHGLKICFYWVKVIFSNGMNKLKVVAGLSFIDHLNQTYLWSGDVWVSVRYWLYTKYLVLAYGK